MIAALFVDPAGVYAGLPDVECWGIERDARQYPGPYPAICHPPCARWGRFWHGSPCNPHQYAKGDDAGCFAAALAAVRRHGGVLEHPAHSHAWFAHGLPWPAAAGGWQCDIDGGWCCHVEQGHYGHPARKPTWLYAVGCRLPELHWGPAEQRLPGYAVERYGYEKARRIGVIGAIGGRDKTRIRNATSPAFRDVLLAMVRA